MYNVPDGSVEDLRREYARIDAQQGRWDRYYDEYQEWAEVTEAICRTLTVLSECLKDATDARRKLSIWKIRDELDVLVDRLHDHVDYLPEEPDQ